MSGRGENKFLVSTRLSPNCIGGWWGCGGGVAGEVYESWAKR